MVNCSLEVRLFQLDKSCLTLFGNEIIITVAIISACYIFAVGASVVIDVRSQTDRRSVIQASTAAISKPIADEIEYIRKSIKLIPYMKFNNV